MKRCILLTLVGAAFLLSGCLRSLEKEGISPETIYKGRVVDEKNNPLSGIMVRITNDQVTYNSVSTDQDGLFQIKVDITKIDNSYYILIGDINGEHRKGQLKGFGMDVYDYGDIPFVDVKLPEVETIGITAMSTNSFTCKCEVKSKGASIVTERGVCWSTNIPTVNDNVVPFGSGEGIYTCTVSDASMDIQTTTYYARAYAKNEYGCGYGEAIEISSTKLEYFSLPSFEFGGYTYHVHPDLGGMKWKQAYDACENLSVYGYNDWYLPNKEEMFAVAEKTDILDKSYVYWTSDVAKSGGSADRYYFFRYNQDYNEWESECYYGYNSPEYGNSILRVIPVRKD